MNIFPLNKLFQGLRYFLTISAKLMRSGPMYALVSITATLASQSFLLLAFFFPLKLLLLLSASEFPSYFPVSWQEIKREHLVIALMVIAVAFYLLSVACDKLSLMGVNKGAALLLKKNKKNILFHDQQYMINQAYFRCSRTLSAVAFVILAFIILAILYLSLAAVLMIYALLMLLLFLIAYRFSEKLRDQCKSSRDIGRLASVSTSIGFFLGFSFIVFRFLKMGSPDIITMIISLVLMRQLTSRAAAIVKDFAILHIQQDIINALFFPHHTLAESFPENQNNYWKLLKPTTKNEWLKDLITEITHIKPQYIDCEWQNFKMTGVMTFKTIISAEDKTILGHYLLKVFNGNQAQLAQNEAILLADPCAQFLPAPLFIGQIKVDGFYCNLFTWNEDAKKATLNRFENKKLDLFTDLLCHKPSITLIERYSRSKPLLGKRLKSNMFIHLEYLTHDPFQLKALSYLIKNFDQIRIIINTLPLQIVNPSISKEIAIYLPTGKLHILSWGKWEIAPLGAYWPIAELDFLEETIKQSQKNNRLVQAITFYELKLCALVSAIENLYKKEEYYEAGMLAYQLYQHIQAKEY